ELEQQNHELLTTREQLETQRHRYLQLFDQAPFAYLVTDGLGVVEEANQTAVKLLGIRSQFFSGKPFTTFLDGTDRNRFRDLLPRVREGAAAVEAEMTLRRRDGTTFPGVLTAVRAPAGERGEGRLRRGERAASLAHQLLAFGRRQVLQPRRLSLNGLLRDMEPMLRRLIGEHIRLEIRPAPAGCEVHADLGQLEQVVLNLVVNARDAMPEGGSLRLATEEV